MQYRRSILHTRVQSHQQGQVSTCRASVLLRDGLDLGHGTIRTLHSKNPSNFCVPVIGRMAGAQICRGICNTSGVKPTASDIASHASATSQTSEPHTDSSLAATILTLSDRTHVYIPRCHRIVQRRATNPPNGCPGKAITRTRVVSTLTHCLLGGRSFRSCIPLPSLCDVAKPWLSKWRDVQRCLSRVRRVRVGRAMRFAWRLLRSPLQPDV